MICSACSSANDSRSFVCRACGAPIDIGTPHPDDAGARHLAALGAHLSKQPPARVDGGSRPDAARLDAGPVVIAFGSVHGAIVLRADRVAGASPFARPEPAPLPAVDVRSVEAGAVWNALDGGAQLVIIEAAAGAGVSTLLHALAAASSEHGFAGAPALCAGRGPASDVEQQLAALLDDADRPRWYGQTELDRIGSGRRNLLLIDRADLSAADVAALGRRWPASCIVIAGSNSAAPPGAAVVQLGALPAAAVLELLEAMSGRRITADNARAALRICATAGSLPAPVRLIGAAAREFGRSFISLQLRFRSGAEIVAALIAALPPAEARILSVLALAQAPLAAHHIAYIIRRSEIRGALEHLTACELLRPAGTEMYALPEWIAAAVPAPADTDAVFARIVAVFCDICDSSPAMPMLDRQVSAAEALVRRAAHESKWREALALGPRVATLCALRGAFGAWARVLTIVEDAAFRAGDSAALRVARHDRGVRALLLGEDARARTLLQAVAGERKAAGDAGGAAASGALAALAAADPPQPSDPPLISAPGLAAAGTALAVAPPAAAARAGSVTAAAKGAAARPRRGRVAALVASGIAAAALAAVTFLHQFPAGSGGGAPAAVPDVKVAPPNSASAVDVALMAPAFVKPDIRTFYASPARIRPGGSTHLCYAVTGAQLLRIVPRVGRLTRLHACQVVTLHAAHRYRYALFAIGPDGGAVTRRLHVDVVAPAMPRKRPLRHVPLTTELTQRAIYQFDATPSTVERGQATSLCVGVERPARGFVTHVGVLSPGITRCYRVLPRTTTVYRLYVALEAATTVQTVTVAVRPASHPRESIGLRR